MSGRWLAGKVAEALLTLVFVLVFNFFLFRVMGDPTSQLARLPQATPEELAELRADYGLDKPLTGQFADYVGDTMRFDLGISQRSRESVWDEIKRALPWTLHANHRHHGKGLSLELRHEYAKLPYSPAPLLKSNTPVHGIPHVRQVVGIDQTIRWRLLTHLLRPFTALWPICQALQKRQ